MSPHNHSGHSHRIPDWQAFEAFARRYADKTQDELVELWLGEISDRTISWGVKKIDLTRKKDLCGYQERSETGGRYF